MLSNKINELRGLTDKNPTDSALSKKIEQAQKLDLTEHINEQTKYDDFGVPVVGDDNTPSSLKTDEFGLISSK